jgi:hypothetical protein
MSVFVRNNNGQGGKQVVHCIYAPICASIPVFITTAPLVTDDTTSKARIVLKCGVSVFAT